MRESPMEHNSDEKLQSVVEMDGVYVNGYIRPKNNIADRMTAVKPLSLINELLYRFMSAWRDRCK